MYDVWPSIKPPVITAPAAGATGVLVAVLLGLTTDAFLARSSAATHLNTDWEVRTAANGGGSVTWSSMADATNKTSVNVPALTLTVSTTYYVRVRYRSTNLLSGWSADVQFST